MVFSLIAPARQPSAVTSDQYKQARLNVSSSLSIAPSHPLPVRPLSPLHVGAEPQPRHPLGSRARVLLCSVFGPYAQDDEFGSRSINPMELYHNQVTRVQGPFSLRMFHRSWGLMLIQANIDAPCALLDFPDLERFTQEITQKQYDIVGISGILPNVGKVRHMCELIRQHQPQATIVIGGHIANFAELPSRIDADHIVRGEGVAWFRRFLGQDDHAPIHHPRVLSGVGGRTMGVSLNESPRDTAATLIPSVGCPMGCNFCSTSAMFGGKGKHIDFYAGGDELFDVMLGIERDMGVRAFFCMDENFLLHRKRALRLLELMQQHNKSWSLYVFSSANVLRSYTIEQLVGLGVSWVWMGLEGKQSSYAKLKGTDTLALVRSLQSHGVRVLGSTIIGLEEHTPDNLDAAIEHAVAHDTEFHQFMLYTPIPGTPLWNDLKAQGRLTDPAAIDAPDSHGQLHFTHRHAQLPPGSETMYLLRAFTRDFQTNGPSVVRVTRTLLAGWKRYQNHPDARVRARFTAEAAPLRTTYAAGVWAARKWFAGEPELAQRIDDVLQDLYQTFGFKTRIAAAVGGRFVYQQLIKEKARLDAGWTYEPPTFYEVRNQVAQRAIG
jgi:hypothetical protein